ncbi:NHL repeat-containing protein [Nocardioides nitrophenolicus]|uniref:NHL repeat-containing protein n=1 Tax=Nocardioides nitrophenolicus TaxID=60489 RepID=UPI00195EB9AA|nr:NHL repeat-containing protein [Nocardioides nitrophenolicus]MBM7517284.1 DNA-binding beta-propeller fold protein YncE [Nocardioides nitrophenolicus]
MSRRATLPLLAVALIGGGLSSAGLAAGPAAAQPAAPAGWAVVGSFSVASPLQLAVSPTGDVWVTRDGGLVSRFNPSGQQLALIDPPGEFVDGIDVDAAGNAHVVDPELDADGPAVRVLGPSGAVLRSYAPRGEQDGQAEFNPSDLALDSSGSAYLFESDVRTGWHDEYRAKYDAAGARLWKRGSHNAPGVFAQQQAVAAAPDGRFFVIDQHLEQVISYDANGTETRRWGQFGTADGQFNEAESLTVSPRGTLFVVDKTDRIQEFTTDGQLVQVLRVQLDPAAAGRHIDLDFGPDGSLFVLDGDYFGSGRVLRIAGLTTPAVALDGTRLKVRKGKARLSLTCATAPCAGKVTIRATTKGKRKGPVLAKGRYALGAGVSAVVKVRLTKAGRLALARKRAAKVRVSVQVDGGSSAVATGKLVRGR